MSETPYKFNDRRGGNYGWARFSSGSSGFTAATVASVNREQYTPADRDASSLLGCEDRKRLMTIARKLYQDSPIVRGCLTQMAQLTTEIVTPQYDGENAEWGEDAEWWLYDNDRWLDVRGWPFNEATIDFLIQLHILRDGDVGVLLTEDDSGSPKVQLISGHRVGSRYSDLVKSGKFAGRKIIDGVIVGDSMETLGYRVLGDDETGDRDFSANDFRLCFDPLYCDQIRGFSPLGASVLAVQDVHEFNRLELVGQKQFSGTTILEHNESSAPESGSAVILSNGTEVNLETGQQSSAPVLGRRIEAAETRYFRAGSQSKLEVLRADRPTTNQQAFTADNVRQAIHALGWSVDYSLDPTKAGGANMRVVVAGINAKLKQLRATTKRVRQWIDPWRIAKAVKAGWLETDPEWWRWEYQFAAEITADAKYDSDVSLQEMRAGIRTQQDVCASHGLWWEDVNAQKEKEARDRLTRAKKLADEFGIPIDAALTQIAMLHPMELIATPPQQQAQKEDSK